MARLTRIRELAALIDFRRLYATRVVSAIADGIFQAALASYVLFNPEKATTPTKTALALAALLLPYSIAGPFVGVFLDRWSRQRVLVVGNVTKLALVLVVAALVFAGQAGVGFFATAIAALGVNRLFLAALSAGLPHVVSEQQLLSANALSTTSGSVATIAGAGIGGVVRLAAGSSATVLGGVVVLSAVAYAASAVVATRIGRDRLGPDRAARAAAREQSWLTAVAHVTGDLSSAIGHLRRRAGAALALGAIASHRFLYGIATLTIVLLDRNYFASQHNVTKGLLGLGSVVGASGAGILTAALITPAVSRRLGKQRWITSLLIAAGVGIAGFGLPFERGLLVIGAYVLGVASQGVKICVDTTVQEDVDDAYRGRVFAVYDMLFNVTYVAAAAVAATAVPASGHSISVMALLAIGYVAAGVAFGLAATRLRLAVALDSSPGPSGATAAAEPTTTAALLEAPPTMIGTLESSSQPPPSRSRR